MEDFMPMIERTTDRPIGFTADFDEWESTQKKVIESVAEAKTKDDRKAKSQAARGNTVVMILCVSAISGWVYARAHGLA